MRQKSPLQNNIIQMQHQKQESTYRQLDIEFFKITETRISICLPASLSDHSHKAGGQTKQRMATILRHSLVGCVFWECVPSATFIFNQAVHPLLHAMKPYQGVN